MRLRCLSLAVVFFGTHPLPTAALDDLSMSLLAKVDPIPESSSEQKPSAKSLSLIQQRQQKVGLDILPIVHVPFSAIQVPQSDARLTRISRVPLSKKSIMAENKRHATKIHPAPTYRGTVPHPSGGLHDPADVTGVAGGGVTPEVLMCYIPAGKNALSVRACDVVGSTNAVLSQTLSCTDKIHPSTVADLLVGSQKVPVDFSRNLRTAVADLQIMDTPVTVQVSFGACSASRNTLPDTDLNSDYVVFVILNPATESAAENWSLANPGTASKATGGFTAFMAGVVMVQPSMLFQANSFPNQLATNFAQNVNTCATQGSCTAIELVQWCPSGTNALDWYIGAPAQVQLLNVNGATRGPASFLQKEQ